MGWKNLATNRAGWLACLSVTGSAIIRPVAERDEEAIAAIYAPNITDAVISFEVVPPDAAEMRQRIVATTATHPWLVYERGGDVLGYVYASGHNVRAAYQWSVNVTAYIDARARRMGVGRALYTSLFALLRLQGFYNAYGGITLPNAGSVGLHEAMGFRLVGNYQKVGYKFGAWHDVGWWGMELQEKPAAPSAPLTPAALGEHFGWQAALEAGLPLLRA